MTTETTTVETPKYNSTVTDKSGFSISMIDDVKYNSLTDEDKLVWEKFRNSFVEMMPQINGVDGGYTDDAIRYSENFAFILQQGINIIRDSLIEIIKTLEKRVETLETNVSTNQEDISDIQERLNRYTSTTT